MFHKLTQIKTKAVFLSLCLFLICKSISADSILPTPNGWSETTNSNKRIISKGTTQIEIENWRSLDGLTIEAYLEKIKTMVPAGAVFVSAESVISEKVPGAFSLTRKIQWNGKRGVSVLSGCPGHPGYVRVMTLTGKTTKLLSLVSGASFMEQVCLKEPKGGGDNLPLTPTLTPDEPIEEEGNSENTGNIEGYLTALRYSYSGGILLPKFYPVILLSNNIVVRDVKSDPTVLNINDFRSIQPEDIGRWKLKGDNYELLWPGEKKPTIIEKSAHHPIAFPPNHRLDGIWDSVSGGGLSLPGGSSFISASTFRFYPDGRFEAGTAVGALSSGGVGSADSASSGTYRIEGPTLHLNYNNGTTASTSLLSNGIGNDGREILYIGGNNYLP